MAPVLHAGRYRDWTENLNLDWCLSRQRYFGVPIPAWYPLDDGRDPIYDEAIVAEGASLPVDPTVDVPPGYEEKQRGEPGGFIADPDIFDTWFTSSMTPQISSHWGVDADRHAKLFPADVRPQAHDIIRTWAFYTIAKAAAPRGCVIPWRHVDGLGLGPRSRPQEDVEEQGQIDDSRAAPRKIHRRCGSLLGRRCAPGRRYRLR